MIQPYVSGIKDLLHECYMIFMSYAKQSLIMLIKCHNNINSLYTGGLFHCYIMDKTICQFRGVRSILWLLFYF